MLFRSPVHAGWVTGGRGIKKLINEDRLAGVPANSESAGQIEKDNLLDAREPQPNSLRLAPGVRGALGRAGSSAGHARAREKGQDAKQRPGPTDSASTARSRRKTGTPAAGNPARGWAELHCHSNYSFQEGASEAWDLLLTAKQLGLSALAIDRQRVG